MMEYNVTFETKKKGENVTGRAIVEAGEEPTREDIERWEDEIKREIRTKREVVIINIFPLGEEKECKYKESCPSRTGWCERKNPNYEQCIEFILTAYTRQLDEAKHWRQETDYWKREAIVMAAEAGEEKIREYEKKKDRSRNDGGDGKGIRQQESI